MTELELIVKNLDKIGTELYNKFGTDSYDIRCELHDIKDQLKAINYTRCSLQLPTKEDYIFWNAPENAKKEGKLNDLSWIDSEEDGIHDLFEEFMEYWKNKAIV